MVIGVHHDRAQNAYAKAHDGERPGTETQFVSWLLLEREKNEAALKEAKEANKTLHSKIYRELITKSQDAHTEMREETRQKAWDDLAASTKRVDALTTVCREIAKAIRQCRSKAQNEHPLLEAMDAQAEALEKAIL